MSYTELLPLRRSLDFDSDDNLIGVKRTQSISDQFLRDQKALKEKRSWHGEETLKVCSVPTALIEKYHNMGINMLEMDIKEVVAILKKEGLDDFISYGGSM